MILERKIRIDFLKENKTDFTRGTAKAVLLIMDRLIRVDKDQMFCSYILQDIRSLGYKACRLAG